MRKLFNQTIQSRADNFDTLIFYLCIMDTLFLPYVWFVSIPYSMPLLYLWLIKRGKSIGIYKEYKPFLLLLVLMVVSTAVGFVSAPQHLYHNIVYLIQFTSMFLYYFVFRYYIDQYDFHVKNLLLVFLLFTVVLAIFFNVDKSIYHNIKLLWNQRSGISINNTIYEGYVGYRYSFVWMDANNIAYMMNALVLYLWCNEKTSLFTKVFSLISLLFILVSCMSNGGFLSFGVSAGLYLIAGIGSLLKANFHIKLRVKPENFFFLLLAVIALFYVVPKIPDYLETGVALESMERIRSNSGSSRILIWQEVVNQVNFLNYIFVGTGGVTLVGGKEFSPHNGHFYWIIGYGMIAYVIFMYIFFRKRVVTPLKQYLWIVPIFIGFTVNIMLGEIKMMGLVLLLIACSSSSRYLQKHGEGLVNSRNRKLSYERDQRVRN
ncbi:MAG: hypothetical protein K0S47_401 [Herbinix sp.]|jgi:hypothetical protein|nr:hypothetical protein [Herbinix sp.]